MTKGTSPRLVHPLLSERSTAEDAPPRTAPSKTLRWARGERTLVKTMRRRVKRLGHTRVEEPSELSGRVEVAENRMYVLSNKMSAA